MSDQVAAAMRAESRAAGLAAADERTYWQRRAVADRASAVARFHEEATVRVSQRDVERAQLEGQLACLRMLDTVDQQTATAIGIAQAHLHKRAYEDLYFAGDPAAAAKLEQPNWSRDVNARLLAERRRLDEEVFFAKPRSPGKTEELSQWICDNRATVAAPNAKLTREMFDQALANLKRQGPSHGIIRGVTGF